MQSDRSGPNPGGFCLCGCGHPTPLAKNTDSRVGSVKGTPVRYLPGHMFPNWRKLPRVFGQKARDGRWYVKGRDRKPYPWARVVMANKLGAGRSPRSTFTTSTENCTDDRPENLTILSASEHKRLHPEGSYIGHHASQEYRSPPAGDPAALFGR